MGQNTASWNTRRHSQQYVLLSLTLLFALKSQVNNKLHLFNNIILLNKPQNALVHTFVAAIATEGSSIIFLFCMSFNSSRSRGILPVGCLAVTDVENEYNNNFDKLLY